MSSKVITLRLPMSTYDSLAAAAAIAGLPLSVYVRSKIDRAEISAVLETLAENIRSRTDPKLQSAPAQASTQGLETLLLLRAVAGHLDPQIPQAVAARLSVHAVGSHDGQRLSALASVFKPQHCDGP